MSRRSLWSTDAPASKARQKSREDLPFGVRQLARVAHSELLAPPNKNFKHPLRFRCPPMRGNSTSTLRHTNPTRPPNDRSTPPTQRNDSPTNPRKPKVVVALHQSLPGATLVRAQQTHDDRTEIGKPGRRRDLEIEVHLPDTEDTKFSPERSALLLPCPKKDPCRRTMTESWRVLPAGPSLPF